MNPRSTLPHPARPDIARIGAMSGAMALNLGALLLLLVPLSIPAPEPRTVVVPPVWFELDQEILTAAPLKPDIKPLPIDRPKPDRLEPVAVPIERIEAPVFTEADWAEPVGPVVSEPVDTGPVDSGPIASATLELAFAPLPRYPTMALRKRWEGVVVLRVLVSEDGRAQSVEIERSSGHRELDAAARTRVLNDWRFRPAMRDGVPRKAWGRVPVEFSLASG